MTELTYRRPVSNRWITAVAAALVVIGAALTSCTPDSEPTDPDSALCREVKRQGELRAKDVTDPDAIAALVDALPESRKTDAALFYYPYGGDIRAGVDRSGVAAEAAGNRLYSLYETRCGYQGD